jgi:hypothetical protein
MDLRSAAFFFFSSLVLFFLVLQDARQREEYPQLQLDRERLLADVAAKQKKGTEMDVKIEGREDTDWVSEKSKIQK